MFDGPSKTDPAGLSWGAICESLRGRRYEAIRRVISHYQKLNHAALTSVDIPRLVAHWRAALATSACRTLVIV